MAVLELEQRAGWDWVVVFSCSSNLQGRWQLLNFCVNFIHIGAPEFGSNCCFFHGNIKRETEPATEKSNYFSHGSDGILCNISSNYLKALDWTIGLDFREMFGILLLKVKCIYESFFDGTIRLRQKFHIFFSFSCSWQKHISTTYLNIKLENEM